MALAMHILYFFLQSDSGHENLSVPNKGCHKVYKFNLVHWTILREFPALKTNKTKTNKQIKLETLNKTLEPNPFIVISNG